MARKRHTPEQIVAILREAESAKSIGEVRRKHNISDVTFHRWKRKYGGMPTSEVARIKALEKENQQLKQLAGDQALAIQVMKEELKNWVILSGAP